MDDFLTPKPRPKIPQPEPEKPIIESEPPMQDGHEALDLSSEDELNIPLEDSPTPTKVPFKRKKRRNPKEWFLSLTKKQKIFFSAGVVAALLIIIGLVLFVFGGDKKTEEPVRQQTVKKEEKPKTEASKLTGLQIDPELNKRTVTGVMIENSLEARPQAGLKEAGVVYEAIAEGGITRFLALFQEEKPSYIGPVRSVRPYYVDWAQGFDAPLVHAGGSAEGLAKIRNEGVKDLDHSANGQSFDRVSNREAPHNLYTSMDKIDAMKAARGYTESSFTGFLRKKEAASKKPTASDIKIGISSPAFNVTYQYNAEKNTYNRNLGGQPHIDEKSGEQLAPKVVIALVMQQGYSSGYTTYNSLGTGPCFIFQDGEVIEGTWIKANSKDQTTFKDARGEDIKLNPGQTWISLVGAAGAVTYTPPVSE